MSRESGVFQGLPGSRSNVKESFSIVDATDLPINQAVLIADFFKKTFFS